MADQVAFTHILTYTNHGACAQIDRSEVIGLVSTSSHLLLLSLCSMPFSSWKSHVAHTVASTAARCSTRLARVAGSSLLFGQGGTTSPLRGACCPGHPLFWKPPATEILLPPDPITLILLSLRAQGILLALVRVTDISLIHH